MFLATYASFRWLWTLGRKFLRVALGPTLLVIPATLVSQISQLLAFLLPLKVIILFGSDGFPRYFPQELMQFDRDVLIVSLSIATPAFYLLHLAMERLIHWLANRGAGHLLERSRKIVLFENQDDIATASYRRYAGALADAVFIACVWLVLGLVYPLVGLAMVVYTLLCIAVAGIAYRVSEAFRQRIEDSLASILSVFSALGFLLVFFLLVAQFVSGSAPNFLVVIISLILARQTFNRKSRLVNAIVNLYEKRRNLNALFFSGHSLSRVDDRLEEFWSLFEPHTREDWLRQLLDKQLAIDPRRLHIQWRQTGVNDLVALEVAAYDAAEELMGQYLIRVYGKKSSLLSSHEATLLLDPSSEHLPSLPLLAVGEVGKWLYHLFSLPGGCASVKASEHTEQFLSALWAYEPPQDLAARYARSHPMLWQRLDSALIKRLTMAAGEEDGLLVRKLEDHLPRMLTAVQELPLIVVNPDINANTLMQDAEGELWVNYWARWTLEPIGSDWPLGQKSLANLPQGLQRASVRRPALQSVDVQAVTLAALLFEFDWLCAKQQYLDALALIPDLLAAPSPSPSRKREGG